VVTQGRVAETKCGRAGTIFESCSAEQNSEGRNPKAERNPKKIGLVFLAKYSFETGAKMEVPVV